METTQNNGNVKEDGISSSGFQRTCSLPVPRIIKPTNLMKAPNRGSISIIYSPNLTARSAETNMQNQHQGEYKNDYISIVALKKSDPSQTYIQLML